MVAMAPSTFPFKIVLFSKEVLQTGIPASGSMTRQEALFALKSLGAQVSDDWYRDENGVPKTDCVLRATKDQWSSLVGEPEMLSPASTVFLARNTTVGESGAVMVR